MRNGLLEPSVTFTGLVSAFPFLIERELRYTDPDMITIHDIMCAWLYTDDTDEAYEELGPEKLVIGQRRGPRRYRVARRVQGIKEHPEFGRPGRGGNSSRHQPHASHGMGTSGADAFADDFGGLGMGDGSRAGYGRSNHRGRDNTGRGPSRPRHDGHGGADMGLSHGGHHGARPDYGSRREPPSRRTYQPQQSGMYESQAHKPSGYGGTSRSHGHMSRYQGGYDDDGDY